MLTSHFTWNTSFVIIYFYYYYKAKFYYNIGTVLKRITSLTSHVTWNTKFMAVCLFPHRLLNTHFTGAAC